MTKSPYYDDLSPNEINEIWRNSRCTCIIAKIFSIQSPTRKTRRNRRNQQNHFTMMIFLPSNINEIWPRLSSRKTKWVEQKSWKYQKLLVHLIDIFIKISFKSLYIYYTYSDVLQISEICNWHTIKNCKWDFMILLLFNNSFVLCLAGEDIGLCGPLQLRSNIEL